MEAGNYHHPTRREVIEHDSTPCRGWYVGDRQLPTNAAFGCGEPVLSDQGVALFDESNGDLEGFAHEGCWEDFRAECRREAEAERKIAEIEWERGR